MINIVIYDDYKSDFLVISVALIISVYALFEAHWPLVACMVLIASGYRRIMDILGLSKLTKGRQVLTIYKDASVQLKSGNKMILRGFLTEQQWCTNHMAVLNISIEGKTHHFAAFSVLQTDRNDFRRLKARLRHNFYRGLEDLQASGN